MISILVVDDEPHATRLLKLQLERAGYQIDVASNGEAALEMLYARRYDLLITDLRMPRMSGRQLCEHLRKQSPQPPIFILTSRPEDEFRTWTRGLQNVEFFEKPVSLRLLIDRIAQRLDSDSEVEDATT